jgi:hypothetical protein
VTSTTTAVTSNTESSTTLSSPAMGHTSIAIGIAVAVPALATVVGVCFFGRKRQAAVLPWDAERQLPARAWEREEENDRAASEDEGAESRGAEEATMAVEMQRHLTARYWERREMESLRRALGIHDQGVDPLRRALGIHDDGRREQNANPDFVDLEQQMSVFTNNVTSTDAQNVQRTEAPRQELFRRPNLHVPWGKATRVVPAHLKCV